MSPRKGSIVPRDAPELRRGMAEGLAELLPMDYLAISRQLEDGRASDPVIAQFTPPDANGRRSPGVPSDFPPLVWNRARRCAALRRHSTSRVLER